MGIFTDYAKAFNEATDTPAKLGAYNLSKCIRELNNVRDQLSNTYEGFLEIVDPVPSDTPLSEITKEHILSVAALVNIVNDPIIDISNKNRDGGSIYVKDSIKDRSLRIYWNGSNTVIMDKGFEVKEYCYLIYAHLKELGYTW